MYEGIWVLKYGYIPGPGVTQYQTLGMFKNITFYSCEKTFPTIEMFPTTLLRKEKRESEFFPFLDEWTNIWVSRKS